MLQPLRAVAHEFRSGFRRAQKGKLDIESGNHIMLDAVADFMAVTAGGSYTSCGMPSRTSYNVSTKLKVSSAISTGEGSGVCKKRTGVENGFQLIS